MAERKPREQEEFEAFLRAKRSYERRLQDIAWKHDEFFPILDQFVGRTKKLDKSTEVFELEDGA